MQAIDRLHDAIDKLFEGRKKSETLIIYSLPFLLLGYLSYQFLFPLSERFISAKKEQRDELNRKIEETKGYLATKEQVAATINAHKSVNAALQTKLGEMAKENVGIKNRLSEMGFIKMDDKNLLEFSHFVTTKASENGVRINSLTAKLEKGEFGVFKNQYTSNIALSANFGSTLSFINSLENSLMFLRIEELNVSGKGDLNSSLKLKVYGL